MDDGRERLQGLHLALEGALEQLTHAQQYATQGSQLGAEPPPEVVALEHVLGDVVALRNQVRDRLMRLLAKPSLNTVK